MVVYLFTVSHSGIFKWHILAFLLHQFISCMYVNSDCHITFDFHSIWTFRFLFTYLNCLNFCWNAVCGFYCSSPVCHCCSLVPGLWFVLAAHLYLSLLLSKKDLWLLPNSLCSFSYISRTIQHNHNVPLSLSHLVCSCLAALYNKKK